ncbi:hypothetical protein [Paenibacillus gorillae]|uniref:hypothetical protein n=1 Tax=Paenibacillus gorillae TaxID=1243662 RepID=UPI0005AAEB8E|nr:hypothetical protein [Paenibacillus gorillae]
MQNEILMIVTNLIKNIIGEEGNPDNIIQMDSPISMKLNSINFIKMIVAVEEKYGFEFDDECLNPNYFTSMQFFISYIAKKVKRC